MTGQLTLGGLEAARDGARESLGEGAWVLRGFVRALADEILDEVDRIACRAPFRHMITPGGFTMSAAMTNCGALGWTSNEAGYRYRSDDPETGVAWPAMPALFERIARESADAAGFVRFRPDACLINRYPHDARLTLHQDKNERDFSQPIVSISLGVDAVFLFGGLQRRDPTTRIRLTHGDVAVWGGPARLRYHGVMPIAADMHPRVGPARINLTFRRAG